jgi:hypothetical protein
MNRDELRDEIVKALWTGPFAWQTLITDPNFAQVVQKYRRYADDAMAVVWPMLDRCPSCDHLTSRHRPEGCWYTVTTGTPASDLVCHCAIPYGGRPEVSS